MGASSPLGGGNIAMPEKLLTAKPLRRITGPKKELGKEKSHGI
jgi:hypothetical protein